jgi:hypothetical protein
MGYAMAFDDNVKVLLGVEELVNMQKAITTALETKDKPLEAEKGPQIVK